MTRSSYRMNFQERVLYVVRSYLEYESYGRDEKRAVKTIHKHHPEVPLPACQAAFRIYVQAYTDAIAFVEAHQDCYWSYQRDRSRESDVKAKEAEFIRDHPDFPETLVRAMNWFIFDWHHVR